MFGFMGAKVDLATLPCADIFRRYEANKLMSTPEGGRSKEHQKESAERLKVLQPYFDSCVSTGSPVVPDQDTAAVGQKLQDDGFSPPPLSAGVATPGFSVSPLTIGLLVVAGLAGVWFLTRTK